MRMGKQQAEQQSVSHRQLAAGGLDAAVTPITTRNPNLGASLLKSLPQSASQPAALTP